ncbi:MAG: M14 family metallocarboxypeptidase [Verrucomicrobiales bacterium]
METIAECGGYPVLALRSEQEPTRERGLYLSAGIHGDEPAAVAGLCLWAEEHLAALADYPVVIFPCLNPWGLVYNLRADHRGRDLNRLFGRRSLSPVREWNSWLGKREFRLALSLHEDYDARGIYLYELARGKEDFGERLVAGCEHWIAREPGRSVEGHRLKGGVLLRKRGIERIGDQIEGVPEAIDLYLHRAQSSMTFETPSEHSLYRRAMAQKCFIEAAMAYLEKEP